MTSPMHSPLQSPLQPVMRSPLEFRRRGGGSAPFDIASTNPSAYYDRTNLATLFQDSSGTTPVTAGSQPIGLGLDKSQGLALGAELAPTPHEVTGTGWSSAGASVSRVLSGSAVTGTISNSAAPSVGSWYEVSFDASGLSGTTCFASYGSPTNSSALQRRIAVAGSYSFLMRATNTQLLMFTAYEGSDYALTISNISVKLLAGNHQSQATAGKRPITDGTPIYANFDAVDDDLGTTFGASLGAGCTVCRSLPGTGASITTGVTIGTTYTDNVDAHALLIYTAAQWAALDAGKIAKITAWLNAKAGL